MADCMGDSKEQDKWASDFEVLRKILTTAQEEMSSSKNLNESSLLDPDYVRKLVEDLIDTNSKCLEQYTEICSNLNTKSGITHISYRMFDAYHNTEYANVIATMPSNEIDTVFAIMKASRVKPNELIYELFEKALEPIHDNLVENAKPTSLLFSKDEMSTLMEDFYDKVNLVYSYAYLYMIEKDKNIKTLDEAKKKLKGMFAPPKPTRFEKARIVGARALQISYGAPVLVDYPSDMLDPIDIALIEFEEDRIPISFNRS